MRLRLPEHSARQRSRQTAATRVARAESTRQRVARLGLAALAIIGAFAIALLVLGLAGIHAVTDHLRIH